MSWCVSDFCPGCNRRNGCDCEADEAATNAEMAAEAGKILAKFDEHMPDNLNGADEAAWGQAVASLRAILAKFD